MSSSTPPETRDNSAPTTVAADLQDERLTRREGLRGVLSGFATRVRTGDIGSLPVFLGLILIWIVFQILNPRFLSATNLVDLTLQCAPLGVIALGVVVVLLVAQIDLSIGSLSGLASAILGVTFVSWSWPIWLSIVAALAIGALIGYVYGFLFTRFGVPTFVVTLAGLMGFLGVQLWVLGPSGTINLPYSSWIVQFATSWFLPPWLAYTVAGLVVLGIVVNDVTKARRRTKSGLSTGPISFIVIKAIVIAIVAAAAITWLATNRGVSVMFLVFIVLVAIMATLLTRTRWGRWIYAVGGNEEAARRAGINVKAIYISALMIGTTLATLGGLMAAARLTAASISSGGGTTNLVAIAAAVIGGTSLFGGRGSAWSALLGIVVIQSIFNGLTLLNLSSDAQFMVTGAVLLLAVIIDALSRRSRASHGTA
ncbi:sugar ABC transporter permease [Microbacterium protaetiae]|uniref:Xylose transport system permease protein XylH n=1 Tax=Microbacterium protaetiae TaxID=2509458 RepID=A0A4P6EBM2_9MICO|nr:sugar ABC transporter permease [Microbacterium protaetiae]QAY59575.1 sugar ABC transporter permease [Microbacterium protaetiae]